MGEHVNGPLGNAVAWLTIAGIILATIILVASSLSNKILYCHPEL